MKKKILPVVLLALLLLACPVMAEKSEDENGVVTVETERENMAPVSSEDSKEEHPGRFGKGVLKHPRDGENSSEPQKDSRREIRSSDAEVQTNPSGCLCRCVCGEDRNRSEENREGSPREGGRPAPEHHHHKSETRDNGSVHREQPPEKQEGHHSKHSHHGKQREYVF